MQETNCGKAATSVVSRNFLRNVFGEICSVPPTQDVRSNCKNFASLMLSASSLQALETHGFSRPSPVQEKAIPIGLLGFDMLVQGKSGTGKTMVFSLLALEHLNTTSKETQVIIVAPTHEIAGQIVSYIGMLSSETAKIELFIGGNDVREDMRKLLEGVHVVVGTSGRLAHLLRLKALQTNSVRLFVLDEADKLMERRYREDINYLFSSLPETKQVAVFSATFPHALESLLLQYMKNVRVVNVCPSDAQLIGIKQYVSVVTDVEERNLLLMNLLTQSCHDQCIIFVDSQERASNMCDFLRSKQFRAESISGTLTQEVRNRIVKRLKNNSLKILVATDLLARGIDAVKVNIVVNIGCTFTLSTYLNRIGRAGRFGGQGASITIVSATDINAFESVASAGKLNVKFLHPTTSFPPDFYKNRIFFDEATPFHYRSRTSIKQPRIFIKERKPSSPICSTQREFLAKFSMAEDGRYLRSQILAVREMYTSDEWFDYALTRYKDCFENELLSKRSRNICTDNLPFPCSSTKEVIDVAQQPKNAVVKNTTDTGKLHGFGCWKVSLPDGDLDQNEEFAKSRATPSKVRMSVESFGEMKARLYKRKMRFYTALFNEMNKSPCRAVTTDYTVRNQQTSEDTARHEMHRREKTRRDAQTQTDFDKDLFVHFTGKSVQKKAIDSCLNINTFHDKTVNEDRNMFLVPSVTEILLQVIHSILSEERNV